MIPEAAIVTIDLGTQSLRVGARSTTGKILFSWQQPVTTHISGIVQEQDPAEWSALCEAGLMAAARAVRSPTAIVACGPLAGFVPLDAHGDAIGSAVMYNDARAFEDLAVVEPLALSPAGLPRPVAADPIPQALRLRREAPDVFATVHRLLDATGFLNYQLTDVATINAVSALRLYDGKFERLGIAPDLFGEPVPTGNVIGSLSPRWSQKLGWSPVPVVSAPFDSKVAYVASGITAPGEALDISGTVTSFGVIAEKPLVDPQRRIYCLPFDHRYLLRGSTAAAGSVIEWARELLNVSFDELTALAQDAAPGAHGALLVPYHSGARAPLWQPTLRGAMFGLSLNTGRATLARSVFEGLAFSLRHIVETIESCSMPMKVGSIRLAGGLAKNDTLSQIKADVLRRPLLALEDTELTSLGLAIVGAVAVGAYPDPVTASRALVRGRRRFLPGPLNPILEERWRDYVDATNRLADPNGQGRHKRREASFTNQLRHEVIQLPV